MSEPNPCEVAINYTARNRLGQAILLQAHPSTAYLCQAQVINNNSEQFVSIPLLHSLVSGIYQVQSHERMLDGANLLLADKFQFAFTPGSDLRCDSQLNNCDRAEILMPGSQEIAPEVAGPKNFLCFFIPIIGKYEALGFPQKAALCTLAQVQGAAHKFTVYPPRDGLDSGPSYLISIELDSVQVGDGG